MAYTPTVWQNGKAPALSAENLNKIEAALQAAHAALDALPTPTNGREVELRTNASHIQWRYTGEAGWRDLLALADLRGPKGDTGDSGDGSGDMTAATYDPRGIAGDAFDRAKHTGTQPIASVSGLDTALAARTTHTEVSATVSGAVSAVSEALGAHAGATKNAHGIADTAALVLTDDPRLSDTREPTEHAHEIAAIEGLSEALATKEPAGAAESYFTAHIGAPNPHPQYAPATSLNYLLRVVYHGDNPDYVRPSYAGPIEWRGLAVPANALPGDTHLNVDVAERTPQGNITAAVTSPTAGATRTVGTATTLEASVTSEEIVTNVAFVVDGVSVGDATYDQQRNRWRLDWTPTSEGAVTITVKVRSIEGEAQSDPIPVTLAIPAPAPTGALVEFPDAKIEFMLAPQVYAGDGKMDGTSATTDTVPWPFVDANLPAALTVAKRFPITPPRDWSGTASGNVFTAAEPTWAPGELVGFPFMLLDSAGTALAGDFIATANTATTVTLDRDATGAVKLRHGPNKPKKDDRFTQSWVGGFMNYYDLGLVAWQTFYRTGDTEWRDAALQATKSYWKFDACGSGRTAVGSSSYAPRMGGISGFILTAMYEDATLTGDAPGGRSEMWDWIFQYTDYQFWIWVHRKMDTGSAPIGVRDPGYSLLFAAQLAACLPDSYYTTQSKSAGTWNVGAPRPAQVPGQLLTDGEVKRDALRAKIARVIAGYPGSSHGFFGKHQTIGGAWRNRDSEYETQGNFSQPFLNAVLAEGLIASVELLKGDPAHASAVAEAEATLMRAAGFLWFGAYVKPESGYGAINDLPGMKWRAMAYWTHSDATRNGQWLDGTVSLTNGSNIVTGVGTRFKYEADHHGYRMYFHRRLPAATFAAGSRTMGVPGGGLSALRPGQCLWIPHSLGVEEVRIRSIESDTSATLYNAAPSELVGTRPDVYLSPDTPIRGEWTVDKATGRVTSTSPDANAVEDLSPGDRPLVQVAESATKGSDGQYTYGSDELRITSIAGPKEFYVSSVNTSRAYELEPVHIRRFPREAAGDPTGVFHVDAVLSETQLRLTQPWTGQTVTGVKVRTDSDAWDVRGPDSNKLRDRRHNSCTVSHVFGWAYRHTGDPAWKERGDEIFSALYGKGVGPGADTSYGLQDYFSPHSGRRLKEFNETYRGSTKYLAYRIGG